MAERPNILCFFADDWGRYAGVYRDPNYPSVNDVIQTPCFDRLARDGVMFNNAYMPVPSCAPCRASFATGSYFWRTGSTAFLQQPEFRATGEHDPGDDLVRFTDLLYQSGYFVASSYKTFRRDFFSPEPEGYHNINEEGGLKRGSVYVYESDDPEERKSRIGEIDEQARNNMCAVLRQCPKSRPFFYIYGPINTHRPWIQGSGKELWGIEPDDLEGKMPEFLPDVHEVREDMADYLGEVQMLDMMVNALIEELDRDGRLENTLVVLTGDNGIPGFPRGKTQLYGMGVQAPLIAFWPGKIKAGRQVDDFVNIMDLAATFLEVADLPVPESMDSQSVLSQLLADESGHLDSGRTWVCVGRERHVANARPGNMPYPSRAIHTKEYIFIENFKNDRWPSGDPDLDLKDCDGGPTKKWMTENQEQASKEWALGFGKRPRYELYAIKDDPDQMVNLAEAPAYTETVVFFVKRLASLMTERTDLRLTDAFDQLPYTDPDAKIDRGKIL